VLAKQTGATKMGKLMANGSTKVNRGVKVRSEIDFPMRPVGEGIGRGIYLEVHKKLLPIGGLAEHKKLEFGSGFLLSEERNHGLNRFGIAGSHGMNFSGRLAESARCQEQKQQDSHAPKFELPAKRMQATRYSGEE
jgi:hypothetical protein